MQVPDTANAAALSGANIRPRHFVRFGARNYSTSAIGYFGYWRGIDPVSAEVIDGQTGDVTVYTFLAAGALVDIGDIAYVCEQSITERTVTVTFNKLDPSCLNAVMGYDLHEQIFEIYEGHLDLTTNVLVGPARPVFVGIIDTVNPTTAADGGESTIEINARSHTTEMTRSNTLKRTHESEALRDANDFFYKDAQVVKDWKLPWGITG